MEARTYPVGDLCSFLAGKWDLDRQIVDRPTRLEGRFLGVGWFHPAAGDLRYEERGWLRMGVHQGRARHRLRLRPGEDGQADMTFADGSPFHHLDLRSGSWHVAHDCGEDRYLGSYLVHSCSAWEVTWTITGPHKEASLSTVYRRVTGGGPVGVSPR